MGDAKYTRVCICKTLKICSNTCVFIRKNPFIFGVFLFAFLIYKYFPSVFSFFIYASPVLVCTLVLIRFLFCLEHSKEQNPKKIESVPVQDDDAKRNKNSSMRTRTSKRRNAEEKSREWDNDNLISRSVPSGGKPNESEEGKGGSSLEGGDSHSLSGYVAEEVQRLDEKPDSEVGNGFDDCRQKSVDGGGSELEVESPEEAEDEDEEGHEYGHKAVEWTEDDQKNLMDLGTSEIERNKRLESLIAKRRARKLMKMQVEKDLIDLKNKEQVGQIAPILIARNNLLHLPDNSDLDSPVPGSAPSVLLPGRNPFDLPYDPQEERPNLLGDSFQREFTIPHQKEVFFRRHESFTFGSFPLGDSKQEPHSSKKYPDFIVTKPRPLEVSGFSRFKWTPLPYKENREKLFQQEESISHIDSDQQGGQLPKPAKHSEGTFHEKEREAELSLIRTEEEEANTNHVESEMSETSDIPMKLELVEDKNNESSSSSLSEAKEHNGQANETSSSSDPSPDDGGMNKEITAGSGETWVASSHPSVVEEIEAMSAEVTEIGEEDVIQVGFSGVNQDSVDSMGLALHPAQGASSSSRDASGIYNASDPALPARDGMEDLKSIGSIDAEPLAEETDPTSSKSIKDEPEKLAVEGNDNLTAMEDIVQDPEKLTAQEGNTEEAETIEDNLKFIRDSEGDQGNAEAGSFGGEQGHVEAGSFGGDQSSDAFTSSTVKPERVTEKSLGAEQEHVEAGSFAGDQSSDAFTSSTVKPERVTEQSLGGEPGHAEAGAFGGNQSSDASTLSAVEPERVIEQCLGGEQGHAEAGSFGGNQSSDASTLSAMEPERVIEQSLGGEQGHAEAGSFGGNQSSEASTLSAVEPERVIEQCLGGEQGHVEAGSFGGDHSSEAFTSSTVEPERVFNEDSGDLIASTVQPELAVEQISDHSSLSSSPKSVLPDKVPVDEVSSWSFNPEVHVTVQQSSMEENSLHELLPPNFNLTMPPNAQHLMEDSAVYSSNNSDYEGQREPSNTSEITSEANISHDIVEFAVHDKEGKEKKSVKGIEDESKSTTLTSQDAGAESSKPDELTVSRSIEDDEYGLERTSAYGASTGPSYDSYPAEEKANSDIPASMATEQEPSSLPMKSSEEANIIHNLNGLEVSGNASIASKEEDKDLIGMPKTEDTSSSRSISDIQAESNKLTEDEVIAGASKAMGENEKSMSTLDTDDILISMEHGISPEKPDDTKDNFEFATDVEGDSKNLKGYEPTIHQPEEGNLNSNLNISIFVPLGEELSYPPPEKSTEEANTILSENEAEADQMNIKQTSESVGDSEGGSQSSISQLTAVGPLETTEVTNSVTIQDTAEKSGQLIHDKHVKDTPEPVKDNATLDRTGEVKKNKGETADLS